MLRKSSYNLNVRATQHYNIIDYFAQAPSTMSNLEVLQTYPMQSKSLLHPIGTIDPVDLSLINFDLVSHIPHIPHQIAFLIQVLIKV